MQRNCRFHGEVIIIKNGKYGSMYVPKEESAPKEGKKPSGDNALDRLREDIERIKDENIKRNRDNLDAMYNIDMRNMSPSMKRLFSHYSSEISDAKAEISAITSEDGAVAKMLAEFSTEVDGKINSAVAGVEATANRLQSSVDIVAKYDDRLSAVETKADENENSVTVLVESIGENGEKLSASIQTAIKADRSFIKAVADEVDITADVIDLTGYVTFNSLETTGLSTVNGNNISLQMNGMNDMDTNELSSESKLNYNYWIDDGEEKVTTIGSISMKASGVETDEYSRYALLLETTAFYTRSGNRCYPAIKLSAVGRVSIETVNELIYLRSEGGACTINAFSDTRLRAPTAFAMANAKDTVAQNDYVFASDGIYYGTKKLIST